MAQSIRGKHINSIEDAEHNIFWSPFAAMDPMVASNSITTSGSNPTFEQATSSKQSLSPQADVRAHSDESFGTSSDASRESSSTPPKNPEGEQKHLSKADLKLKNKVAARRCREKKKQEEKLSRTRYQQAELHKLRLFEDNMRLRNENADLRNRLYTQGQEVARLRQLAGNIMTEKSGCDEMQPHTALAFQPSPPLPPPPLQPSSVSVPDHLVQHYSSHGNIEHAPLGANANSQPLFDQPLENFQGLGYGAQPSAQPPVPSQPLENFQGLGYGAQPSTPPPVPSQPLENFQGLGYGAQPSAQPPVPSQPLENFLTYGAHLSAQLPPPYANYLEPFPGQPPQCLMGYQATHQFFSPHNTNLWQPVPGGPHDPQYLGLAGYAKPEPKVPDDFADPFGQDPRTM